MLAGPAVWLDEIEKTRLPYNINVLTQVSAEFALRHQEVFDRQTAQIRNERESLFKRLQALDGVVPLASQANFILLRLGEGCATRVFERLRTGGVLVKSLHGSHPLLNECLRVTVGTPRENQAFLEAFENALDCN